MNEGQRVAVGAVQSSLRPDTADRAAHQQTLSCRERLTANRLKQSAGRL